MAQLSWLMRQSPPHPARKSVLEFSRVCARTGSAQTVQSAAARDGGQPRKSASASFIKIAGSPPNLQKDFLQNIFRLLAVIQYTKDEAKQD